jgi:hypothetical protein
VITTVPAGSLSAVKIPRPDISDGPTRRQGSHSDVHGTYSDLSIDGNVSMTLATPFGALTGLAGPIVSKG